MAYLPTLRFALPLCLAATLLAQQSDHPFRDSNLPADKRIDNLLASMTLEEKVDCLGTRTAIPRLGVPNMGSSEGIHGVVQRGAEGRIHRDPIPTTQFPQPPGMGQSWDPELVRQAGDVEGSEARYITETKKYDRQLLVLWGPQSDLARDPRWGRSEEVYSEDPFLAGTMAVSFIKGLQGDDPKYWQAAALLKHFLANSNENNRATSSSNFDDQLFWDYYSKPFRMGFLEGGAKAVMASYNSWNGTPMAINPILKSIVEDKWGVDILSSDGGAVKLLYNARHLFKDQKEAVVACLKAGINQFLDVYRDETLAALKDGSITEREIDDLLRRKFRVALKLGLLDPPQMVPYTKVSDQPEPWTTEKHKDISLRMALESTVLLKNENATLPLRRESLKSIAVIGPLADSVRWDWYGGFPPSAVTPLAGIRQAVGPNVTVNYASTEIGNAAVSAARKSDVAIVVVGNDPTCGPDMAHDWGRNAIDGGDTLPCTVPSDGREGRDRESLTLEQEQLVKQVRAVNPRTILVLVSSFPYTINWSQEQVPAILHMVHSSQDEGTALARVLFGDYNPAGRLTTTWPKSIDQLPPMMDYDIRHGRTYMYSKGEPLYPFGFGLSYTSFRYANLHISAKDLNPDGIVTVSVDVTNTGERDGDEVVQLYTRNAKPKAGSPREQLCGFARVNIAAHATKTVQIPLKAADLAIWNDKTRSLQVPKENLELAVGSSSSDIRLTSRLQVR